MTNKGMEIKHPKRRGEWAEMRFLVCASEHGLCVSKPWGDTAQYDFVVENVGRLLRVQVKSSRNVTKSGYAVAVRGSAGIYQPGAFDFVAAYLIPEDLWYIIPAARVHNIGTVNLCPGCKKSKYARFREAWDLLRSADDSDGAA